jgi:small subunit ribosomal protein S20
MAYAAHGSIWVAPAAAGNVVGRARRSPAHDTHTGTKPAIEACPVANIKSQIKRIKTNEKARQRNKAVKSSLKTSVRKFNAAAEAGDAEQATALAREASRKLDKAASKGVIHKNQAANRKSAIAQRAASL